MLSLKYNTTPNLLLPVVFFSTVLKVLFSNLCASSLTSNNEKSNVRSVKTFCLTFLCLHFYQPFKQQKNWSAVLEQFKIYYCSSDIIIKWIEFLLCIIEVDWEEVWIFDQRACFILIKLYSRQFVVTIIKIRRMIIKCQYSLLIDNFGVFKWYCFKIKGTLIGVHLYIC